MDCSALLARYEAACTFSQDVDHARIVACLRQYFADEQLVVEFIRTNQELEDREASRRCRKATRASRPPSLSHRAPPNTSLLWPGWVTRLLGWPDASADPPLGSSTPSSVDVRNGDTIYQRSIRMLLAPGAQAARRTPEAEAARQRGDARGMKELRWIRSASVVAGLEGVDLSCSATTVIGAAALGDTQVYAQWLPMLEAFESGAWQLYVGSNHVYVILRPEVMLRTDEQGRLHCTDGPALVWPELGVKRYFVHGVKVREHFILHPETIRHADMKAYEKYPEVHRFLYKAKHGAIRHIEQLTPAQEALWPEYVVRWEAIGRATEPADRALAEEGVRLVYEAAGCTPPRQIIWTLSPAATFEQYRERCTETVFPRQRYKGQVVTQHHSVWHENRRRLRLALYKQVWAPTIEHLGFIMQKRAAALTQSLEHPGMLRLMKQKIEDQLLLYTSETLRQEGKCEPLEYDLYDPRLVLHHPPLSGQQDAARLVRYAYYREVLGLVTETEPLVGWFLIAQAANWWLPYEDACWISERPRQAAFDANNRLHRADGPAIEYQDGWGVYAWRGIRVPKHVIMQPETISITEIDGSVNIELRRVLLERFGEARYIEESGAEVIDTSEFGTLYRRSFGNDEPLVMLRVVNSTPERDGSFKQYWLRVPPRMRTAHEAVAWTFGMTPAHYQPHVES